MKLFSLNSLPAACLPEFESVPAPPGLQRQAVLDGCTVVGLYLAAPAGNSHKRETDFGSEQRSFRQEGHSHFPALDNAECFTSSCEIQPNYTSLSRCPFRVGAASYRDLLDLSCVGDDLLHDLHGLALSLSRLSLTLGCGSLNNLHLLALAHLHGDGRALVEGRGAERERETKTKHVHYCSQRTTKNSKMQFKKKKKTKQKREENEVTSEVLKCYLSASVAEAELILRSAHTYRPQSA